MDFYRIDEKYNKYLQDYEKRHRGFTKVPNVCYSDRNKFSFGAVLEINGSLRFNYMIPVPDECIVPLVIKNEKDEKYKDLLNKEYRFCKDNEKKILNKASKIYDMVINNKKQKLTDNSCDFIMLEKACLKYKKKNV